MVFIHQAIGTHPQNTSTKVATLALGLLLVIKDVFAIFHLAEMAFRVEFMYDESIWGCGRPEKYIKQWFMTKI